MPCVLLTTPRSERNSTRERRVLNALGCKLSPPTLLLTTAVLRDLAVTEVGEWPSNTTLPAELRGAERRAAGDALRRKYAQKQRDVYRKIVTDTLDRAHALIVLPRSDSTIGQGVAAKITTANRLSVAVHVISLMAGWSHWRE
jgi:hypothetical protein